MSLRVALPVVAISLLILSGCVPTVGEVTDDSAPTPTPTETKPVIEVTEEPPVVNISSIVIDGDSVSVNVSEGGLLIDIPFTTDPATAAAQLSDAIDLDPITSVTPPASCGGNETRTTWGGITFVSPYAAAPAGAQFWATADAKLTSNGITVAMLGGQWVGYDGPSTMAAYPGAELDYGLTGSHVLAYDVKSGTADGNPDDFYGGIAVIEADLVTSFSAPVHYWYDC